jgi:hypothetical protein
VRKEGKGPKTMSGNHSKARKIFNRIYASRAWGKDGRGSGPGSRIDQTQETVSVLEYVILWLGVQSMLDAPCGGREWQTPFVHYIHSKIPSFRYLGLDVAEEPLAKNIDPLLPTRLHDLTEEPLPTGYDLVLSRDALQHNSYEDIRRILLYFACSDASYFLIGSYPNHPHPNRNIQTGDYFSIDLNRSPFHMKPWKVFSEWYPTLLYDQKYHKSLYLYNRSQLQQVMNVEHNCSAEERERWGL